MDNINSKKQMTEAERLELAKKLDEDLDSFIDGLEKRKYTEGWQEDRWEEEMDKHPFFMKKAPEPGEKLSPLMEGLQQLKYDANENSPEELANAYKDDGNFNFKHKNYRLAIIAYTEGIKIKCGNDDVQASLYNNRSAAQYFLQNYRSSLRDAQAALRLKPGYEKALIRSAHCCNVLQLHEEAIKICDDLINKNGPCEELINLRTNATNAKKVHDRDARRKEVRLSKLSQNERNLLDKIASTGISIEGGLALDNIEPRIPHFANSRVRLDANAKLIWPVIASYPEYQVMDFIQEFHEDDKHIVKGGTLSLIVVAANSPFEKHFVNQYS